MPAQRIMLLAEILAQIIESESIPDFIPWQELAAKANQRQPNNNFIWNEAKLAAMRLHDMGKIPQAKISRNGVSGLKPALAPAER